MMQLVELYHSDLEVFAHKQLPRFHMPRSFHDRADSSLILLARQCPYLHTLVRGGGGEGGGVASVLGRGA